MGTPISNTINYLGDVFIKTSLIPMKERKDLHPQSHQYSWTIAPLPEPPSITYNRACLSSCFRQLGGWGIYSDVIFSTLLDQKQ